MSMAWSGPNSGAAYESSSIQRDNRVLGALFGVLKMTISFAGATRRDGKESNRQYANS
jgi:hypothetical protein